MKDKQYQALQTMFASLGFVIIVTLAILLISELNH